MHRQPQPTDQLSTTFVTPPGEIRNKICIYVLGNRMIHIGVYPGSKRHKNRAHAFILGTSDLPPKRIDPVEFLLAPPDETAYRDCNHQAPRHAQSRYHFNDLLLLNCQASAESMFFLYTTNCFSYFFLSHIEYFASGLTDIHRSQITDIHIADHPIGIYNWDPRPSIPFPNLETVYLYLDPGKLPLGAFTKRAALARMRWRIKKTTRDRTAFSSGGLEFREGGAIIGATE